MLSLIPSILLISASISISGRVKPIFTLKISKIIEQYLKYDKREECNCKNILQGAEINKQV